MASARMADEAVIQATRNLTRAINKLALKAAKMTDFELLLCFISFLFYARKVDVSKDFAIIEINYEFMDRHYCDIFKLVALSAAIDSNHPINCYPIVCSKAFHRIFP